MKIVIVYIYIYLGAYLSEPKTEKDTHMGEGNGLRYALTGMQGWRSEMEVYLIKEYVIYGGISFSSVIIYRRIHSLELCVFLEKDILYFIYIGCSYSKYNFESPKDFRSKFIAWIFFFWGIRWTRRG